MNSTPARRRRGRIQEPGSGVDALLVFFGGLGLIFTGMTRLTASVQEMIGRKLRLQLARATQSYPVACGMGLVAAGLAQSMMPVFFMVSGLVQSNAMTLKRAADVLSWAYIGLAIISIILVTRLDSEFLIMILLGATGILHYFGLHQHPRFRHVAALLLAVALLMLGIDLVGRASALMQELPALRGVISLAAYHPAVALGVGIVVGIVMPTYLSITAIAVSLASAGMLDFLTVCFVLSGAVVGNMSTWPLYVARLDSATRSLAYFDWVNRLSGAVIVTVLLLVEWYGLGAPIGVLTLALAPTDVGERSALIMLVLQTIPLVQAVLLRDIGLRLAGRFVRSSAADSLATPKHLPADGWTDPATALDLTRQESLRLLAHLTAMIETIQHTPPARPRYPAAVYATANRGLAERIDAFLQDALDRTQSRAVLIRGGRLAHQTQLINDMTDTLAAFLPHAKAALDHPSLAEPAQTLVESLHFVISTATDALAGAGEPDLAMARTLTADKSQAMANFRTKLADRLASLSQDEYQLIFDLTALFDRLIWTLHRVLLQDQEAGPTPGLY